VTTYEHFATGVTFSPEADWLAKGIDVTS